MFEQTFKNIDDVCEKRQAAPQSLITPSAKQRAELQGKKYQYIIDAKRRWSVWAAPKKRDGSFDHDKALVGDDLIKHVPLIRDTFVGFQEHLYSAE